MNYKSHEGASNKKTGLAAAFREKILFMKENSKTLNDSWMQQSMNLSMNFIIIILRS